MVITKKIWSGITVLIICVLSVQCEDVIDIEVPNGEEQLIIDALVRVDTSQALTSIRIRVTESISFFEEPNPGQVIQMSIANIITNEFVLFEEDDNDPGVYVPVASDGSIPVEGDAVPTTFLTSGDALVLAAATAEQLIVSFAQFVPTVPIDSLEQGDEILFDEDDREVIVTFTDDGSREDYYIFDFDFDEFITTPDTFFQGEEFQFSFFYDGTEDGLTPGETAEISILGADIIFFNYFSLLLEQSQQGAAGPFQTPAATVRGNIIDITNLVDIDINNIDINSIADFNIDATDLAEFSNVGNPNFVLGYFAVVQEFTDSITIE